MPAAGESPKGRPAQLPGGVVEAGWLVALAIVPLEVAVGADRPFEPAKAIVVQVLAVVMAGAWLVRRMRRPGARRSDSERSVSRRAFVAATGVLAVLAVAGTALSLSPKVSFAGSSVRAHGLLTLAAVWIIGVLTATELRDHRQVIRLLHVATVAAVPVAALAVLQRHGIDAIPVDRASPPGSTFGNPLLLAGWLVTVTPLVAARLGVLLAGGRGHDRRNHRHHAAAALIVAASVVWWWTAPLVAAAATVLVAAGLWFLEYQRPGPAHVGASVAAQASALGIVLAAVLAAAARGPVLGLAGGAVVCALAATAGRRRLRLVGTASAGALAVVAVLAVVGLRAGDGARNPSEVIGAAVAVDRGTFAVRDRLWAAGEAGLRAGDPLPGVYGDDPHDLWRPLVGYGPDVSDAVLGQYADPDLWRLEGRDAPPDRAHNAILDTALQFGWLGAAAFGSVLVSGAVAAMRRLGVLRTAKAGALACALVVIGASSGAAVGAVAGRSGWWAPGAGLGLAVAIAAALAVLRRASAPTRTTVLVTAGWMGALVAHWVELQAGVETVASMTTWWIIAAVLVAPWRVRHEIPAGDSNAAPSVSADALAVVTGLIAGTALHAGSRGSAAAVASAVTVTIAIGTVLAGPSTIRQLMRAVALTVAAGAAVAVPAATLAHRGEQGVPVALGLAASVRVLVVVGMIVALGAAVRARGRSTPRPVGREWVRRIGVGAVAVTSALALLLVGVGPAVAALWRGTGVTGLAGGDAHRWAVRADRLDLSVHGTIASARAALRAAAAVPPEERSQLLARAREGLASARQAFPFSAEETFALADLHVAAADDAGTRTEAQRHLTEAVGMYAVASNLRPGEAGPRALEALVWADLAALQGEGTAEEARASAARSLAEAARLDPRFALVPAVHALLAPTWQTTVTLAVDAFAAIHKPRTRRDRYDRSAASVAQQALSDAQASAKAAGEERAFVDALSAAATTRPSVDAYLAVAKSEAALGNRVGAAAAVEQGRALLPRGDHLAAASLDAVLYELDGTGGAGSPLPTAPGHGPG